MGHIIPLPPESTRKPKRSHRGHRHRAWFRRPGRLIPVALLGIILLTIAIVWGYLSQSFDQINTLTALPNVVPGESVLEGSDVTIDTAPAQQAIMQAESTDHNGGGSSNEVAAAQGVRSPVVSPMSTPVSLAQETESTDKSVNILLMGVDARPGEPIDVGVRPDSLSVLHLDLEARSCRLLGIPRDTRTELPGYGLTKINHALAVGGIPYQQLVVENLLGIQIDHYGLVDFAGVVGVVDALGGIRVENPEPFDHQGFHFAAGNISLDGEMALAYSRYRYDEGGDFARIDRQQQVIRAILSDVSPVGAIGLLPRLIRDLEGHFKTDYSMLELAGLINNYGGSCTAESLETRTLEGTVAAYLDPMFNLNLSYVILDPKEVDAKVEWLIKGD